MPDSYNDRSPTASAAPKPARTSTGSPSINEQPAGKGTAGGGTDNIRAGYETYVAGSTRPETSKLKRTGAAVASFTPDAV